MKSVTERDQQKKEITELVKKLVIKINKTQIPDNEYTELSLTPEIASKLVDNFALSFNNFFLVESELLTTYVKFNLITANDITHKDVLLASVVILKSYVQDKILFYKSLNKELTSIKTK